jgi:hypothetical protein
MPPPGRHQRPLSARWVSNTFSRFASKIVALHPTRILPSLPSRGPNKTCAMLNGFLFDFLFEKTVYSIIPVTVYVLQEQYEKLKDHFFFCVAFIGYAGLFFDVQPYSRTCACLDIHTTYFTFPYYYSYIYTLSGTF